MAAGDVARYTCMYVSNELPLVLNVAVPLPLGVTRYHTERQTFVVSSSVDSSVASAFEPDAELERLVMLVAHARESLEGVPKHVEPASDQFNVMDPVDVE